MEGQPDEGQWAAFPFVESREEQPMMPSLPWKEELAVAFVVCIAVGMAAWSEREGVG